MRVSHSKSIGSDTALFFESLELFDHPAQVQPFSRRVREPSLSNGEL